MFEREIRDLSTVPRWPTLRTIQKQNVAEHSLYVAIYAQQIAEFLELSKELQYDIMLYSLWHDIEETFTSDIPGPWKRKSQINDTQRVAWDLVVQRFGVAHLPGSEIVAKVVKISNLVDEIMFLANDLQMGNKNVEGVALNAIRRCADYVISLPEPVTDWRKHELMGAISDAKDRHMKHLSNYLMG